MIKDVQNQKDLRNVPIQKVGVKDVEIPLKIERKNPDDTVGLEVVYTKAKMSVSLPSHFKGTHMSRFIEILNEYKKENLLSTDIETILFDMKKKLDAQSAYLKFSFKYFIEKIAPVSKNKSLMCYDCAFEGEVDEQDDYNFFLIVKVPITTLCPCSKEISKYGAHNQRALLRIKISYDKDKHVWLEDLIKMAEECASSEIYPLLKREDEKFVTERAYENPKFVEDIIRDIVVKLRENEIINFYEVEMEAMESIHNHNAWAYQKCYK
ncbi:MAG: GTP cyclohydrolase I FolE2 [Candidatus Gastranaerophilales bacterium]|nr:GTP cyclohydrolase I FolE2 [Candidatus Gastranaerophilales bacterium]